MSWKPRAWLPPEEASMRSRANMACVLKIALAALCAAPPAGALDITLPAETASFKASDLPGYPLVQQNCLVCHSAQYVQFQPPSSPPTQCAATEKTINTTF